MLQVKEEVFSMTFSSSLFEEIKTHLKGARRKIVFPEPFDERILRAAGRLSIENLIIPVFIGERKTIETRMATLGISFGEWEARDPGSDEHFPRRVQAFVERRRGKISEENAKSLLEKDANYYGTLLVYMGEADGLVSGAAHSTADTVRPALQIIKTKPDVRLTSGAFIMMRGEEKYLFSDCAINISPSSEDLAEIAVESARTAQKFGIEPRVAILSFSTKGSAVSPETKKAARAAELAQRKAPDLVVDGELQFDAAFVPEVAAHKAPRSPLAGQANVFVFPGLEAGNICYKMVQRLGEFNAVGPILQGLNKPVNDLSRGCSTEDVYRLALITARQSLHEESALQS